MESVHKPMNAGKLSLQEFFSLENHCMLVKVILSEVICKVQMRLRAVLYLLYFPVAGQEEQSVDAVGFYSTVYVWFVLYKI